MSIVENVLKPIEKFPGVKGFILYWKKNIVASKIPENIDQDELPNIIENINNVYEILNTNSYNLEDMGIQFEDMGVIIQNFSQGKLIFFVKKDINYKMFTMSAEPILKKLQSAETLSMNANRDNVKSTSEETTAKKETAYVAENILDSIQRKMSQMIGPMGKLLFSKNRVYPDQKFPQQELKPFIKKLSSYIPDEEKKENFLKEMLRYSQQITNMRSTEKMPIPPATTDPLIGLEIGGCCVHKMIGAGGIGKVYKGVHKNLGMHLTYKAFPYLI